jgi:hypothetical protein
MTRTRVRAIVLLGCLALIVAGLAGPRQAAAQSDQWDALFDRMIRLEHEVRDMKSGGGAVPLNPSAIGSSGAVEDQLRQVMAMLDQIRQTQRSLELRLERLEGTSGGTTGSIYEPQSQAPYTQSDNNSFDFSQYESRELAQMSAEQDVTIYRDYEPQTVAQPQVLGTLSGTQAYEAQGYQTQGYQTQGYQTQGYEQGCQLRRLRRQRLLQPAARDGGERKPRQRPAAGNRQRLRNILRWLGRKALPGRL